MIKLRKKYWIDIEHLQSIDFPGTQFCVNGGRQKVTRWMTSNNVYAIESVYYQRIMLVAENGKITRNTVYFKVKPGWNNPNRVVKYKGITAKTICKKS
jgi:hypothetical protein